MTSWLSKSTLQRLLDLAGLHYTTSERSGPFWQSMLHNFLSRPLSFLGWTTAMLFWLDFHQTQSNLYKWFRIQSLHLSLSPCTGYQLQLASSSRHLMLAYRTTTGSAPAYFHSLLQIYIPSRSLKNRNRIQLKKSESYSQYNHPHLKNNLKACVRPLRQHVVVAHKILMFKTVQIHTQGSHMQPNFSMVRLKKI